ncbi:hypothetical protein ACFL1H_01565 [Nanoarchaeota archaeon]
MEKRDDHGILNIKDKHLNEIHDYLLNRLNYLLHDTGQKVLDTSVLTFNKDFFKIKKNCKLIKSHSNQIKKKVPQDSLIADAAIGLNLEMDEFTDMLTLMYQNETVEGNHKVNGKQTLIKRLNNNVFKEYNYIVDFILDQKYKRDQVKKDAGILHKMF